MRFDSTGDERPATFPEWQPIETAPEGQVVLLVDGHRICNGFRKWNSQRNRAYFNIICRSNGDYQSAIQWGFNPTHWMPQQEPPALSLSRNGGENG